MIDSFELQNELSAIANHAENYDIPHEDDYADKEPNELLEGEISEPLIYGSRLTKTTFSCG